MLACRCANRLSKASKTASLSLVIRPPPPSAFFPLSTRSSTSQTQVPPDADLYDHPAHQSSTTPVYRPPRELPPLLVKDPLPEYKKGDRPAVQPKEKPAHLVMKILRAGPMSTKEIYDAGLKIDVGPVESHWDPPKTRDLFKISMPKPPNLDHTFRSIRYLKKLVLPVMESQGLIKKVTVRQIRQTMLDATGKELGTTPAEIATQELLEREEGVHIPGKKKKKVRHSADTWVWIIANDWLELQSLSQKGKVLKVEKEARPEESKVEEIGAEQ